MNFFGLMTNGAVLTAGAEGQGAGGSMIMMLLFWGILIAFLYFIMIKPQKKQAKEQENMQNSLEPGDSIMTTSGFYGTILAVEEDTVIVEFGNNKNCRIPMHKRAIAEVEKANAAVAKDDVKEETEDTKPKASLFKKKKDKNEDNA